MFHLPCCSSLSISTSCSPSNISFIPSLYDRYIAFTEPFENAFITQLYRKAYHLATKFIEDTKFEEMTTFHSKHEEALFIFIDRLKVSIKTGDIKQFDADTEQTTSIINSITKHGNNSLQNIRFNVTLDYCIIQMCINISHYDIAQFVGKGLVHVCMHVLYMK